MKLAILLLTFLFCFSIDAQNILWHEITDIDLIEQSNFIETQEKNYLVFNKLPNSAEQNKEVILFDNEGNKLWNIAICNCTDDYIISGYETTTNYFYIYESGKIYTTSKSGENITLIKELDVSKIFGTDFIPNEMLFIGQKNSYPFSGKFNLITFEATIENDPFLILPSNIAQIQDDLIQTVYIQSNDFQAIKYFNPIDSTENIIEYGFPSIHTAHIFENGDVGFLGRKLGFGCFVLIDNQGNEKINVDIPVVPGITFMNLSNILKTQDGYLIGGLGGNGASMQGVIANIKETGEMEWFYKSAPSDLFLSNFYKMIFITSNEFFGVGTAYESDLNPWGNLFFFRADTKTATSINNLSFNFSVAPNPVAHSVSVTTDQDIDYISISSLEGRKLIHSTENQIDLSSLNSGSYLINLYSKGSVRSKILIKE